VHPEWLHQLDSSLTEVLCTLWDAFYRVGDVISRHNQLQLTATLGWRPDQH
jgi:hypothetical protein